MPKTRIDLLRDFQAWGEEFHEENPRATLKEMKSAFLKRAEAMEKNSNRYQDTPKGSESLKAFRGGFDRAHDKWVKAGKPDAKDDEKESTDDQ